MYKFMRIKMKISFHACMKRMSVLEHFIVVMISSYRQLRLKEAELEEAWMEDNRNGVNCISKLNMVVPMLQADKIRSLLAFGAAFAPKLKGLAKLHACRARLRY